MSFGGKWNNPASSTAPDEIVPPLAKLAQPKSNPSCEEFAMDADDDKDEVDESKPSVYDQVWCDRYGGWHRYDDWDDDEDYDYE